MAEANTKNKLIRALILVFRLKLWATVVLVGASVFLILSMLGKPWDYSVPVNLSLRANFDSGQAADLENGKSIKFIEFTEARVMVPLKEVGLAERACLLVTLLFDALWTYLILQFLKDVHTGRPFLFKNAVRVRWVGLSLIASGTARQLGVGLLAHRAAQLLVIPNVGVSTESDPQLGYLLLGALIILCAELFRLGAQLQQEQDLTV